MTAISDVSVAPDGTDRFRVDVRGPSRTTTHTVRVSREMVTALGWPRSDADLVRESFAFLLEREPQTSILREFDLDVIGRYFPEYPGEMERRGRGRCADRSL